MILSENSLFRRLPISLSRVQVLYLDGIRFSAEMADLAYQRLVEAAWELTLCAQHRKKRKSSLSVSVLLDAWAIVDAMNRLRTLVQGLPGLKKGNVRIKLFLNNTASVHDLRNKVQHLATVVSRPENQTVPIWGHVAWVGALENDPEHVLCCTLAAGTLMPGQQLGFDLTKATVSDRVDQVRVSAHGIIVSLTDVMAEAEKLVTFLEECLVQGLPPGPAPGSDIITCILVKKSSA